MNRYLFKFFDFSEFADRNDNNLSAINEVKND